MTLVELLAQIARRDPTRSEATLQADIRQLVLTAPLSLTAENVVTADLETPVGVRRRIDIEVGSCLIEVKRDLSAGNVLTDAIAQLADYLAARQIETGCRYVGILIDGSDWRCFCLPGEAEAGPPREGRSWRQPSRYSISNPGGTSRPSGETSAPSSPRARPDGTWRRWSRSC